MKNVASYPLRLPFSIMREARRTAAEEGVSLGHCMMVAGKLAALRTRDMLDERARRADFDAFDAVLERLGPEPPRPDDRLPER